MYSYKINFSCGTKPYYIDGSSETKFTLNDADEALKEQAASFIRAFFKQHPEIKEMAPTNIVLCCGDNCILDCIDLTDSSINQARFYRGNGE